jgi:hypothetical protein
VSYWPPPKNFSYKMVGRRAIDQPHARPGRSWRSCFLFVWERRDIIHETLHKVMKSPEFRMANSYPVDTLPIITGFASHISSLPRQRLFVPAEGRQGIFLNATNADTVITTVGFEATYLSQLLISINGGNGDSTLTLSLIIYWRNVQRAMVECECVGT